MVLLIPDESSLVSVDFKKFYAFKNAAGYHPGLVAPSTADPASLKLVTCVVYSNSLRSMQKIRSDLFTMAR